MIDGERTAIALKGIEGKRLTGLVFFFTVVLPTFI